MDIAEFLHARIAEDEAVAREATPGRWSWTGDPESKEWKRPGTSLITDTPQARTFIYEGEERSYSTDSVAESGDDWYAISIDRADAEHIARWDPVRVLVECEARRGIVDLFRLLDGEVREAFARRDHETERDARNSRFAVQMAMQALALPYADHPDYQPEWSPLATI